MTQISKGDTFADTQQLTAARLNQLVDSASLQVGAISEQTAMAANTVEASDSTLINDSGALKKVTFGDILGSGIPVVSSSITSSANKDFTITPNDGTLVTGSTYISSDGLTVTVTTIAAHGLSVNNVVLIASAGTGYNGTYRVTAVTTYTFQYILTTVATITLSATACNYTRKATNIVNGSEVVSDSLFVNTQIVSPAIKSTTSAEFNLSTTKTSNITIDAQYSGVSVMGLASISETTIPFFQCDGTTAGGLSTTCNQWKTVTTISSLTKTDKEMWIIDVEFPAVYFSLYSTRYRIVQTSTNAVLAMQYSFIQGYSNFHTIQVQMTAVIPVGTTFTADSLKVECFYAATAVGASSILNVGYGGSLTDSTVTKIARITKYNKP